MNKIPAAAALAAVLAATLTGCAEPSDPEQMKTRCEGIDKIYIVDDPNHGSELFVVHNHPECSNGTTR